MHMSNSLLLFIPQITWTRWFAPKTSPLALPPMRARGASWLVNLHWKQYLLEALDFHLLLVIWWYGRIIIIVIIIFVLNMTFELIFQNPSRARVLPCTTLTVRASIAIDDMYFYSLFWTDGIIARGIFSIRVFSLSIWMQRGFGFNYIQMRWMLFDRYETKIVSPNLSPSPSHSKPYTQTRHWLCSWQAAFTLSAVCLGSLAVM